MAYIKVNPYTSDFIQVPYWFIRDYMPKAAGGYVKVYLYLLSISNFPNDEPFSIEAISKKVELLQSDVIQALEYWNEKQVLKFSKEDDEHYTLLFNNTPPISVPSNETSHETTSKVIIHPTKPEYRSDEINYVCKSNQDVKNLFKKAENCLGRMLTISDQKTLFSFYDWLHMPFDLIEFLLEYCIQTQHTSMRYIEKVAINWADQGILTLEQAKLQVLNDKRYFKILSALGTSKASLTDIEKTTMNKWFNKYEFKLDIILEACKRTVMQTANPSLNYVDSILTRWFNEKVKTLEDVLALDKLHQSKKSLNIPASPNKAPSNKVSKFNTMYTHDWDFDEIERLEREYIERMLNGGH